MAATKKRTGINVGSSSILVIFIVICLTTFAALSMVSANSDYKLSKKMAQATTEYYEADTQAQSTLAQMDAALKEAYTDATTPEQYRNQANAALLQVPGTWTKEENNQLQTGLHVPVNENQQLQVVLTVLYNPNGGPRYTIEAWNMVTSTNEVLEDEPLGVWNPNEGI